ncbi:MAG: hypothetical protein ACWA6Y_00965 [Polaromonas sp.]
MNRHNAPPVVYPLGRSLFLRRWLLTLWLAGLLSVLLWAVSARLQPDALALALVTVLGAGMAVRLSCKSLPCGQLAWDGDTWRREGAGSQSGGALNELSVIADLQSRLLLRFENQAGKGLWLWVERSSLPERWLDLRRAVYSPHKSATRRLPHGRADAVDVMDALDVMDAQASSFSSALPAAAAGGVNVARGRP